MQWQWRRQSLIAMRGAVLLLIPWALSLIGTTDTSFRGIDVRPTSNVGAWPSKSKRWALVIGVDKYSDTQISTLGGSSNDAQAIADALVRYAGFPQDQVILLASNQPAERQPTRGNILRRLSNLASVMSADGLLFFSFAGHGMERDDQAFLLPSDAQVSNDVDLLEQTAINVAQIKSRIRATGVKQVLLVLDACRNDPSGRANVDNPLTAAYLRGFNFDMRNREVTAFATLYATAVGERAYEYTEKQQGYFTWELVEGLKGAAANAKGEITLSALLKHVQERVPKRVLADLGTGKEQRPFAEIGGYQADQLIIAVASTNKVAPPATNTLMSKPSDQSAFELAYWETIKNSRDPEDFKSYLDRYPDGQFAELALRRTQGASTGQGPTVPVAPAYVSGGAGPDVLAGRQEVAELLAGARASFASGNLVYPTGSSAADRYRAVLRLQPRQSEAVAGLERIAASLVAAAERALKSNDTRTASRLVSQARSVQPNYPRLDRLEADIESRAAKLQRREDANLADSNAHIAKARIYLEREATLRNVAEANDHYDKIKSLTPTAPELNTLRERISSGYVAAAQGELAANQPARAAKVVAYARKRKMSSAALEDVESSIQQR